MPVPIFSTTRPTPDRPSGLVPPVPKLAGVTELRVHGVGGTTPGALLGDLAPQQVAGDARRRLLPDRGRPRPARRGVLLGRADLPQRLPGALAAAAAVHAGQPGRLDGQPAARPAARCTAG